MASIEVTIHRQKYVLTSDESENHLQDVAQMVARKIEQIRKQRPNVTLQKAAILAAFDFASMAIHGKKRSLEYQSTVLSKAHELLGRVESELSKASQVQ